MTSLQRTLDLLNEHAPPAPPAIFAELWSIDFACLTASEFETLVSIVLRARADCIVVVSAGPELRSAYANVLPDVAALMRTSFVMRPDDRESMRFFEKFAESVRELNG